MELKMYLSNLKNLLKRVKSNYFLLLPLLLIVLFTSVLLTSLGVPGGCGEGDEISQEDGEDGVRDEMADNFDDGKEQEGFANGENRSSPRILRAEQDSRRTKLLQQNTKYYEHRMNFLSGESKKPLKSGKQMIKIYPFPYIKEEDMTNLDDSLLIKAEDISKRSHGSIKKSKQSGVKGLSSVKQFMDSGWSSDWSQMGITGVGPVNAVDYDINKPERMLIGTEHSGIYLTENGGNNWKKLNFFNDRQVHYVVIDKNNSSHFIASGRSWDGYVNNNIYESFDNGESWHDRGGVQYLDGSGIPRFPQTKDMVYENGTISITTKVNNTIALVQKKDLSSTTPYDVRLQFSGANADSHGLKMKKSGFGLTAGTKNGTLWKLYLTKDYGQTWNIILSTYNNIKVYDITSDGNRISVIYVYYKDKKSVQIAKTVNQGVKWGVTTVSTLSKEWTGETKSLETSSGCNPQDLILLDGNPNYVGIFVYMKGFFESYNNGKTFEQKIDKFKVSVLKGFDGGGSVITPHDIRWADMKVVTGYYGFKSLLLNTDQAIYSYTTLNMPNIKTHQLNNIVKDLYLGVGDKIAITSTGRIYGGLWHVGSYMIDHGGDVYGYITGENNGYGIGPDNGDNTAAFSPVHGYLKDGIHLDEVKTKWFHDNIQLGWPVGATFDYHNNWWYMNWNTGNGRRRVNNDFNKTEIIYPNSNTSLKVWALGFDEYNSESGVYVRGSDNVLRRLEPNDTWSLIYNFNSAAIDILNKSLTNSIAVYGNVIILYDTSKNGMLITQDAGGSWTYKFTDKVPTKVIFDKWGRIYVAAKPALGSDVGGVYYSSDNGENFVKWGSGLEKVPAILDLAINYAGEVPIIYANVTANSLWAYFANPM